MSWIKVNNNEFMKNTLSSTFTITYITSICKSDKKVHKSMVEVWGLYVLSWRVCPTTSCILVCVAILILLIERCVSACWYEYRAASKFPVIGDRSQVSPRRCLCLNQICTNPDHSELGHVACLKQLGIMQYQYAYNIGTLESAASQTLG